MGRNTKFRMQYIDEAITEIGDIGGITIPQTNFGVSIGGKDKPDNNATEGADWLEDLDNIPDDIFRKLLDTLDNVSDGSTYAKVLSTDISNGHIVLSSVEGNIDDIDDGISYGKVLITSISAGKIVLSEVTGDLDDITDGANYGKVASTNISAGNIVLKTNQDLGDQGIKISTSASGARVELLPDNDTGIHIKDDDGKDVFKVMVGGTGVGDVYIGDYGSNQGMFYNKSINKFDFRGELNADDINAGTLTGRIIQTTSTSNSGIKINDTSNIIDCWGNSATRFHYEGDSDYYGYIGSDASGVHFICSDVNKRMLIGSHQDIILDAARYFSVAPARTEVDLGNSTYPWRDVYANNRYYLEYGGTNYAFKPVGFTFKDGSGNNKYMVVLATADPV